MYKIIFFCVLFLPACHHMNMVKETVSKESYKPSVEELRIELVSKVIPETVSSFDVISKKFQQEWLKINDYSRAAQLIDRTGNQLWLAAKNKIRSSGKYDDRSLYWQRLKLSKVIRTDNHFQISDSEKQSLLQRLENASRGINDLEYRKSTDKRILLTGFDPFLLDISINQSNPSGSAAILLDGMVIEVNGITAEINTFIVPVRYDDFDQGFIEKTLSPFYTLNNIDLITTVSMGRKHFDLERFPGKRRSARAPCNQNVYTGASSNNPLVPKLYNLSLPGDEFVEFSLPVKAMLKAKGKYKVIENNRVRTLEKTFKPNNLSELKNSIAIEGGGGGYLSNEISYRSIRLRNQLNSSIPTGHIHTPRINQYDAEANKQIIEQIINMLKQALTDI